MVGGLLLLVLAEGLAVVAVHNLVLTAHGLIAGAAHQDWDSLSQLDQQRQQA